MIMRRRFHAILILLVLALQMIGPRVAAASDIEWKINWQDNGVLQEEIHLNGRDIVTADLNWNVSKEGDRYILCREVENWLSYGEMKDRLPLQVQSRNYLVCKKTEIMTGSETAAGLFQQLSDADNLIINITVPGFITGGSGERIDESTAKWVFINQAELLQQREMMTVITANGLLLGIEILFLGLVFVAIKFRKHLKIADRIIEEEYSLTKIKADDLKEGE